MEFQALSDQQKSRVGDSESQLNDRDNQASLQEMWRSEAEGKNEWRNPVTGRCSYPNVFYVQANARNDSKTLYAKEEESSVFLQTQHR